MSVRHQPSGCTRVHRRGRRCSSARTRAWRSRSTTRPPVPRVRARHDHVLQTGTTEEVLAAHVLRVPRGVPVGRAVVLADQPRLRVEQVGYPQQAAVAVPDRLVDQRCREARVEHPQQPHPRLARGDAELRRQPERPDDAAAPAPRAALLDVRRQLAEGHELGRCRHVQGDDGLTRVVEPSHLVEDGPHRGRHPDARDDPDLHRGQRLTGHHGAWEGPDPAGPRHGQRDGQPRPAVGLQAVEVRRTEQASRCPPGDRSADRQPHGLLEDPLLDHLVGHGGRDVVAVARPPPASTPRLMPRGAGRPRRVQRHRVHEP